MALADTYIVMHAWAWCLSPPIKVRPTSKKDSEHFHLLPTNS